MKKFSAIFVCFVVMLFSGILFAESGEAIVIEFGADDVYRNLTAEELGVTDVFYIAGKRGYPGIPILMDMVDYGRNDFTLAYLTYLDGKKIIKTKQLIINRDYPFNLLRDIDIVNPIANEYNFVKDKFDYEIELSENDQYFKFKPIGLSVQSYEVRNNGLIDHIADVKVKANREPFDVVPLHEGMNTVWIKTILYNQVSYNYKFNIYNPPMVSDKNYNPVITTTGPATAFKTLTVVDPDELDSVNLLVESPSITLDEVYKTINMKIEGYDGQTYEIWNNDKLIESNKLENNKTKFPTTPLEIGRNSIEVKLIINKFVQKVYSLELENINDGRYLEGMFLYNTFLPNNGHH